MLVADRFREILDLLELLTSTSLSARKPSTANLPPFDCYLLLGDDYVEDLEGD